MVKISAEEKREIALEVFEIAEDAIETYAGSDEKAKRLRIDVATACHADIGMALQEDSTPPCSYTFSCKECWLNKHCVHRNKPVEERKKLINTHIEEMDKTMKSIGEEARKEIDNFLSKLEL